MFSLRCALVSIVLAAFTGGTPLTAQPLPCRPCAGVRVDAAVAGEALAALAGALPAPSDEPATLVLAWEAPLDGTTTLPAASAPAAGRITRWLTLPFRTPPPLAQNAERLQAELSAVSTLAAAAPAGTFFQVVWLPEGAAPEQSLDMAEYAFLLKRAAVAVTGAQPEGRVVTHPLPAGAAALEALYAQDVAAYLEAVAVRPGSPQDVEATAQKLIELDPGRLLVVDAVPLPGDPRVLPAEAARWTVAGASLVLFQVSSSLPESFFAALTPLAVLAREFAGDLSYDTASSPESPGGEAWSFVRGEDLALRVIAVTPEGAPQVDLRFPDPNLGSPVIVDAPTGQTAPAAGNRAGGQFVVHLYQPRPVTLLRLQRLAAADLEAVEERLEVAGERQVPVEEILRRLQGFEDAQARRLEHYQAVNTTHLRFQVGASSQSFEATLEGPFFWSPETGADWVWRDLFVGGVRWRGKTIPEIPLVQPEKAAAMPLEIHFTRQYRYRLRGTDQVDGRDAWVVDFSPAAGDAGGDGKLYQGTVWVDREIHSRLRTRAVQVGLEGEVISNEETLHYTPIDAAGQPAAWGAPESFVLPLRIVAQQILSVVNAATVVERETLLRDVRLNAPGFAEARQAAFASEATMVRDTPQGLRYLVKDEASGERVVKEGFDTNKLFLLGGVFYDDALDFPLPLAGINYFSFDFKGTGQQVNAFFGGALLTVDFAEPRLFGSKLDAGADFFALAVPLADTVWREDEEVEGEEVEVRSGNVGLKLGRPLGNFVKLTSEYTLAYADYGTTDNTAPGFVPPENHLRHSLALGGRFARSGWRVGAEGSLHRRSKWEPWGLPGNPDFFDEARDYSLWGATLSKTWHLPSFQKIGAEVDYAGGQDLDRFSKYGFGFFGATRVHGYQSDRVRADEVWAGHLSYGFEIGEILRLEAVADAALATDEAAGLDQELLAGVGVNGTFMGPWQTVVNLDVGVPVQGPDDGFVLYVVFLKLFR